MGSVARHRVYYKGEGGGFPQVRAVVSLMCPCYLWLILCNNHFVWVVCKPVWVVCKPVWVVCRPVWVVYRPVWVVYRPV